MSNNNSILSHSSRDWPEDALSDPDNGAYSCQCMACGQNFTGHKRRVCCKDCDTKITTEHNRRAELLEKAGISSKDWVLMSVPEIANMHKSNMERGMMVHDLNMFRQDLTASLREIWNWTAIKTTPWAKNAKELLDISEKIDKR
jgi:hypothetical protein